MPARRRELYSEMLTLNPLTICSAVSKRLVAIFFALSLVCAPLRAQNPEVPPERAAARTWFQDAKLGMFIHWGVYSLLGQGEWVMQNRSIPVRQYEWLASTFNPVKFNAHDWVALAKSAGVRYITITSRCLRRARRRTTSSTGRHSIVIR
jgi:alpha-L-fucosidase